MLDHHSREGIKEGQDGKRGGGRGRLFEIFLSKGGDYSREAISRGTAIIRGNMVAMETKTERKHCLHRNQIIRPLPNVRTGQLTGQLDRHFENEISFPTEGSHNIKLFM